MNGGEGKVQGAMSTTRFLGEKQNTIIQTGKDRHIFDSLGENPSFPPSLMAEDASFTGKRS